MTRLFSKWISTNAILAYQTLWQKPESKLKTARILARYEWYIGTLKGVKMKAIYNFVANLFADDDGYKEYMRVEYKNHPYVKSLEENNTTRRILMRYGYML